MRIRQRWIDLLHAAATGTRRTRALLTPVGMLIFVAFTALFVLLALLVDHLLHLPSPLPNSSRLPVSMSLIAIGSALTAWSAFHFMKVRGTPVPFNPPPKLVTTGPYRLARNPMLTGIFVLLFGIGCGFNSLSLVVVFTPLYILANVWELKQIEEPELIKRLGEDYIEYRNRTPMFVPGTKTRAKPKA
jgi:protein-S-isoprenylcysteine O-methyltransferase Ste14